MYPLDELGAGLIPCWFQAEQILNLSPNTWNFSIKSSQRLRDYSARAKGLDSAYSGSKFNHFLWRFIPGFFPKEGNPQGGEPRDFAKGQMEGRRQPGVIKKRAKVENLHKPDDY